MRNRFDAMFRWWKESNGHSHRNGNGRHNGDVHDYHMPATASDPALPVIPAEPPWLAQLDQAGIPRTLRYPNTTLGRLVDQAADRFGDSVALVYNSKRWTYHQLLARINRLAGGLHKIGVRSGDRVVMTLPNCPEYVLTFFAIQKLGAIVVNAGPLMGTDDLRSLVSLTKPRVLIGLDLLAPKIIDAAADSSIKQVVWVTLQSYQSVIRQIGYQIKLWRGWSTSNAIKKATHTSLDKLIETAPAKPPTVQPSPDAIAVLQPTSGTTGALKLVELSHRNLISNATQVTVWMGGREGQERVLTVLPMFHVYGLMTGLINPISMCGTIILMTRFESEQTLDVLLKEHPTVFPLVPAICDALSNEIEHRHPRPTLRDLRICISGAAPMPREVAERFEHLTDAHVIEGYGLSETSPVTHCNLPGKPRYGSIGLPMPDTMCRVVDLDEGVHDVPIGKPGELLVSGPQIMRGYFGNQAATHDVLVTDDDGRTWLHTGDVVRVDEDGFFQVLDRKKDMIIHSGLKVYPAKVEKLLTTHAQVADAAVIGEVDRVHTEEVVAFIVLKSTEMDRAAIEDELRQFCRQHLAPYEVPSRFEFTQIIPRSALGKVLKTKLREQLKRPTEPPPPSPAPRPQVPEPATKKEAA
jgi:long-chain acyl-CoA synthetase